MRLLRVLPLAGALFCASAFAALPNGAKAPDFTTQASLAGKPFTFSLADALKRGPVVLYFYPAAFPRGCTIEAHVVRHRAERRSHLLVQRAQSGQARGEHDGRGAEVGGRAQGQEHVLSAR